VRRALVVAHPDDESLFFGGLVIAEPGDWTIICCSIPRTDPERAWKLFDACEVLGAKARLLPFVESGPKEPLQNLNLIDLSGFDQIVTHNTVGEYGHQHHVQINRRLMACCPDKILTGGYGKSVGPKRIALNERQLGVKMAALRCYDHTSPSDGKPKWRALIDRYGSQFDLGVETYDR
jgi:LmbE family N-acetylglucosaminyl deacetylase